MAKLLQIQVGENLSTPDGLPSNRVPEPPAPLATVPGYPQENLPRLEKHRI